jgi:predicted naringenin-chalcone synthase
MSFRIRGLGTANPPGRVTPDEGLGIARVIGGPTARASGFLPAVYANSGNKTRFMVHGTDVVRDLLDGTRHSGSAFLPNGDPNFPGPYTGHRNRRYARESVKLAVAAAGPAVAAAGFTPDSITHLVTVSCTGFVAPGIDLALIRGLCLRPTVERTHVGFMGCHGALNGLRVANAYAAADPAARVLVCAVELCSLHYHFGDDPEKVVANALFADGAAAVAGDAAGGHGWRVAATGSCLLPDSADAMTWTIGDHGFEMTLGKQVPRLIARNLRGWMADWLGANGLSVAGVGSWAIHPGGPKILEAVEEAIGLPRSVTAVSREVFAEYGNMSSPTVLFILDRLMSAGAPRPCVLLGFGPGLVAEAVLLR